MTRQPQTAFSTIWLMARWNASTLFPPSWHVVGYLAEHPCSVKDYDSTKVKRKAHREAIWQVQTWALSDQKHQWAFNSFMFGCCPLKKERKKKSEWLCYEKKKQSGERRPPGQLNVIYKYSQISSGLILKELLPENAKSGNLCNKNT